MRLAFITIIGLLALAACNPGKSNTFSLAHESEPLLRVPSVEPESLDPRMVRTLAGSTAVHMIYDGLFRQNYRDELIPAIASGYELSPDLKTYTIHLKETNWSNGEPLLAEDFYETWMSQLDPAFPAPNAYQLYLIDGAKAYKEGRGSKKDVGITLIDPFTIEIKLEKPAPYFPQLLATRFFLPIHETTRNGKSNPLQPISNGPFVIERFKHNDSLLAKRNKEYWDSAEVKLDEVELVFVDDNTALNMFLAGELHWAGSPISNLPTDSIETLNNEGKVHVKEGAATTFFRINTERFPFKSKNFRKALDLAIDREEIAEHLMYGKQTPSYGLIPSRMRSKPLQKRTEQAWFVFQEALKELKVDKDSIPTIKVCYSNASERNAKIAQAVQQQWQNTLGIRIDLEQCENVVVFDKLHQLDYDIALGSWIADFNDPINFLEVFQTKETPTNNTGWENSEYISLLEKSSKTFDPEQRQKLMEDAEKVLLDESPIIPLFHINYVYATQPGVYGVTVWGILDFKNAFIDDPDVDELFP